MPAGESLVGLVEAIMRRRSNGPDNETSQPTSENQVKHCVCYAAPILNYGVLHLDRIGLPGRGEQAPFCAASLCAQLVNRA